MFDWLATSDMPADGLTKLLPPQKHTNFIKQLNLVQAGVVGLGQDLRVSQTAKLSS